MLQLLFIFANAVEKSIPIFKNGSKRVDEIEKCGHYRRWKEDFNLVQELGLRFRRNGSVLNKTLVSPNKYNWFSADATFAELKRLILPAR